MTHIDMSQSTKTYLRTRSYDPFPLITAEAREARAESPELSRGVKSYFFLTFLNCEKGARCVVHTVRRGIAVIKEYSTTVLLQFY